ncbi:MAG: cyclic 2,3-diphosphoglycerate synthase [Gaiellaceae bacterium]|nr:cyclic 2,3-diphosphoglycerate synthase [Gaiellaceae bacterium]
MRALAIVDGEHYPDVVRAALAELPYDFVAVMLVGGTEKLRGAPDYGVPIVDDVGGVDVAVDLSDEPVLDLERRLALASRFLAAGIPYVGADFRFDPPTYHPFALPSIAVIGTGKRVGKTAVTGHVARLLARDRRVVVVAMGRGGPAEPELISTPPTLHDLIELSRSGRHAASDHLETAALAGVPTIGCRRAGGGMAGAPFASNVLEGAQLAASLEPDVVIFDGSGAAIPPIATTARILVAHDLTGLNAYRSLISDLVLKVGEDFSLRLRPLEPLTGRVAVFTTGPAPTDHLDADVVHVSRNLARRDLLQEELARVDADTYLVEVKAAAIDVVAEHALSHGARVVLADNEVVAPGLDEAILALVREKVPA